jgi:NodT family efflux transporter outer membrane factor (OMF) lipoprotein
VLENWWSYLGDADLTALIEEAFRQNHDLKIAAARMDAALAQSQIAGADIYPRANVSFDSARRQQNFVGLPIPGAGDRVLTSRSTTHGVALNLSWELDLWGRVRAGRQAALTEAQASTNDFRAAQQSLAAQTAKAWIAATEAGRQLDLARDTAKNYSTTAQQVRTRYERGIRPPLDLRLSLASESGAKALVAQRERELQSAQRQLEILLGRYPSAKQGGAKELPKLQKEIPAGLPSELLDRRPDLVAAERRMAGANTRVQEARAALFPRIALTTTGGRSSSELSDLLSNQFNVWALAANVAQPIFEGGRLRGNIKLAQARAREASESFAATTLRAFSEVENALASEELLTRREIDLAEATEQSTAAVRLAEQRYNAGLEDFVTLLEAQRRALESESQLLSVRRLRLDNRIDLHLALGGGFHNNNISDSADANRDR